MELLEVRGLTKRYPSFVLDQAGFSLSRGEIMGLIGRNGAGKSTMLKCLTGFVHPDAGEIRFFGMPLQGNEKAIRQRIAFMSGGVDYYVHKRLKAITQVTRSFYGDTWDDAAYRRYMATFELDEGKTPSMLSAGMRVKYSLALAMSHGAELLILDEPSSGLDPISRDSLMDVFLQLQREGVSILFSTHITADLEKSADSITYIQSGRVLASRPIDRFLKDYLLVTLDQSDIPKEWKPHLIGLKPAKHGYTALIRAAQAGVIPVPAAPATLDDLIVHLEKENKR